MMYNFPRTTEMTRKRGMAHLPDEGYRGVSIVSLRNNAVAPTHGPLRLQR